ncbi:MAG: hypothetical protein ACE5HS_19000, partial [bacterium]
HGMRLLRPAHTAGLSWTGHLFCYGKMTKDHQKLVMTTLLIVFVQSLLSQERNEGFQTSIADITCF